MERSNFPRATGLQDAEPPERRRPPPVAPSLRELRGLLRQSPLLSPSLRAHWLQVLPHLTPEQRRELATLLRPDAPAQ